MSCTCASLFALWQSKAWDGTGQPAVHTVNNKRSFFGIPLAAVCNTGVTATAAHEGPYNHSCVLTSYPKCLKPTNNQSSVIHGCLHLHTHTRTVPDQTTTTQSKSPTCTRVVSVCGGHCNNPAVTALKEQPVVHNSAANQELSCTPTANHNKGSRCFDTNAQLLQVGGCG